MVRGLSDHLDLHSDEPSPVALSKRASRKSITPPPPPPPPPPSGGTTATLPEHFHQLAPPPPPPPGTPPAQRNRASPVLRIAEKGASELSVSYRSKKHQSPLFHINTSLAEPNTGRGPSSSTRLGGSNQEATTTPHSFHDISAQHHGGESSHVDPIMQQGYDHHQHRPRSNRSSRTPTTGSTTRHHHHHQQQQDQQQQQEAPLLGSPTSKMLAETVKEISTAASGTLDKLREWGANSGSLYQDLGFSSPKSEVSRITPSGAATNIVEKFFSNDTSQQGDDAAARYAHFTAGGTAHNAQFNYDNVAMPPQGTTPTKGDATPARSGSRNGDGAMNLAQPPTVLQDLAWPFMACGSEIGNNLKNIPHREQFEPQLRKVKEALTKAVQSNIKSTEELWRLAQDNDGNASLTNHDELGTAMTYDTIEEEENNQIRRLGSWGTINTMGTADTDHTSLHSKSFDASTAFGGLEDDDGHAIDPVLFEKTQQTREKRMPRRKKLVKFDYPPISSLRQCPRPNPADLPKLFFTEGELDQIEDDRYATMSTDDVEIVAVSSKNSEEPAEQQESERGDDKAVGFKDSGGAVERDPPEQVPLKSTKGRPSTPFRHRARVSEPELSGTGNDKRLVKGVQIFLRERSTGA